MSRKKQDDDLTIMNDSNAEEKRTVKTTTQVAAPDSIFHSYTIEDIEQHEIIKEAIAQVSKFKINRSVMAELSRYTVFNVVDVEGTTSRPVPTFFDTPQDLDALPPLFEKTQAGRDFIYQRQVRYTIMKKDIDSILVKVTAWLFRFEVINKFKTAEQRRSVIDSILAPVVEKQQEIILILNICNTAYENLKNASFALKEISEIARRSLDYKIAISGMVRNA